MIRALNPKLTDRPKALVSVGSYATGYTQGSQYGGRPQGSYVEKRLLPPSGLGSPIIEIRACRGTRDVWLELGVHTGDLPA